MRDQVYVAVAVPLCMAWTNRDSIYAEDAVIIM